MEITKHGLKRSSGGACDALRDGEQQGARGETFVVSRRCVAARLRANGVQRLAQGIGMGRGHCSGGIVAAHMAD